LVEEIFEIVARLNAETGVGFLVAEQKTNIALTERQQQLSKAATEFGGYIRANGAWIPNYGERYRCGEAISSAFVESAVNQVVSKRMVKKQQMRWTPKGAHLLLQIRTRVLNDDLATSFQRWYPAFIARRAPVETELAA